MQLAPAATRAAARIGLGKVAGIGAREREAGDAQGGVAGIGQGDGLSRTGGADGLAGESETGGGKAARRAPSPVPVRLTVWGLPVALSVRVTAAVRVPLAAGVKVTLIVQLAPAATRASAIIGLSKVAGIGARERDAGDAQGGVAGVGQGDGLSRTGGADGLAAESQAGGGETGYRRGAVPVPERLTVWGLPLTLSVMDSEAVRLPLAAGLKVTLIVQLALAAASCRRCWFGQSHWHWRP